jgi:uncharacterized protein (TIGR02265 family)
MLHPIQEVLKERSQATAEVLQESVEQMKKNEHTGCIIMYMLEGEYTIAFLDGNLITLVGPMTTTLEVLLERASYGEICVFTVEKKIFSSYIGYLEKKTPYTGNGMPLNELLVELVNRKHTGTIEVTNSAEDGIIFLIEGVPETAIYSDGTIHMSGTEALEGIMKMAEEIDPDIVVYSTVESVESLKGVIPIADMKVRGLFFNTLKSHIKEKAGEKGISLFNVEIDHSRYFDLLMYPLEEFMRASEIARTILECTDYELGKIVHEGFKKSALGRIVFFMEDTDTPSGLAQVVLNAWSASTNYGERWIEEDTDDRIVIRVKNDGDSCERSKGVLAGAMESIGYGCTVKETECEKRGGRFCEFVVEWDTGE